MPLDLVKDAQQQLPEGFVAVPISVAQLKTPLQVCVVLRPEPDPISGHYVVLRDTIDARVLLGAILDQAEQVHDWLEIWVQDLDGLTKVVPSYLQNLSNEVLDQRWLAHTKALDQLGAGRMIKTGWEGAHPPPTYIDLTTLEPVHPADPETGHAWALCQDDQLLRDKGLPIYATSLHRYLYQPQGGTNSPLVSVTREAPTNASVRPLSDLTARRQRMIPFNPGAGLLMVRPYSPVSYEVFVNVLGGKSWQGLINGRSVLDIGKAATSMSAKEDTSPETEARLFMGHHGRWGRVIETFHLKLRLLADAVAAVRSFVAGSQRPVLNLSPESFRVHLGQQGTALPFLWTASTSLVDPGDAIALPIRSSDADYYLPGAASGTSIYQPRSANQSVQGRGSLRIRQLLDTSGGVTILEGTFSTHERIEPAAHDLIWMRLNLRSARVDLYARLEKESALAEGEWRFRTIGQRLSDEVVQALRAAEGVPMPDVRFEVIPLLSTPYDLYSLGVLAVRTLLVNPATKLAVALDELLSLARQVSKNADGQVSLAERISAVFESDERYSQSLGPQRLVQTSLTPEEAFDLVPPKLWWDTLATVIRMFPGVTPDCPCRDFGHAQQGGAHKVFDTVLRDLDVLLLRTRSLIVIDWRFNREVHAVIRKYVTGIAD